MEAMVGPVEAEVVVVVRVGATAAVPVAVCRAGVDPLERGFMPARFEALGLANTGIVCLIAPSIASACN